MLGAMKTRFAFFLALIFTLSASDACDLGSIRASASELAYSSKEFMQDVNASPAYRSMWAQAAIVQEESARLARASQCTIATTDFSRRLTPRYVTLEGMYLRAQKHHPDTAIETSWSRTERDYASLTRAFRQD